MIENILKKLYDNEIMSITKNSYVTIEYTLKDEKGEILDSSKEMGPLEYVQGFGMIIPGLETAMMGKKAGDEFSVDIEPKDAYGEYDESLIFTVDKKQFPPNVQVEVGMEFETEGAHARAVRVIEIEGDNVKIDANHQLAGEKLHFDVKVLSTRMATDEEIAQFFSHSCSCGCGDDDASCGCSGCSGCH